MAFWKLKLFKSGPSSQQKNAVCNDYGHHLKEEINDEKSDYIFKREDSPKMDSISSLEEAYANLPLVKISKPDVTKRQLSSKHVSKQNRPPRQSLTMEEARRQQESKISDKEVPPSDDSAENNSVVWHPANDDKPPNSQFPEDQLATLGLPSWRNEKLTVAKQPVSLLPSNYNSNSGPLPSNHHSVNNADVNGKPSFLQYSPSLSNSEKSRISQDAKSAPTDQCDKGKNLHISCVTIPQPQQSATPCFVVNNPCMFTGSYPCYVVNVMHSTPYVPVQIYPMMLVPNQQIPNRMNNKMVY